MPIFLRDGRAVLFVHVPKTGGTTIERLFTRSGWKMRYRATARTQPEVFPFLRCSPQHYHAAVLEEMFVPERFETTFLLTRDPVARFRSEYVMRNTRDPRTDAASVEQWADRALDRYRDDAYAFDNHLRPQSEFRVRGAEVYRLEDGMEAVVADLNERFGLGLDSEIPHSFHSAQRAGVASADVEVSPALTARLTDFYRTDYEAFGYPMPGPDAEGQQ
ncbi:sulfotransferase family 2 domain-containing protein [Nocardioides dongkuii]|uniref:sulfotransferase family 2 domain-containing protein n=1 Tax=Nocardioides dongkuii TaxID=2760089 RepID=UPI0015FD9AAD|nr:sulfotransferase family 2 domain-containing protein [Nocardioides dongkuii]